MRGGREAGTTGTVIGSRRQVLVPGGVLPGDDVHVVRHERGDLALEDRRVALYHEHVVNLDLEVLVDD